MIKHLMLLCVMLFVIGCNKELSVQETHPNVEQRLLEWENTQYVSLKEKLVLQKMPLQHRQFSLAVLSLTQSCARNRLIMVLDGHVNDVTFDLFKVRYDLAQKTCANDLVQRAIVEQNSDRAYEVSLAIKQFDPNFKVTTVPSYVSIDE